MKTLLSIVLVVIVVGALGGAGAWYVMGRNGSGVRYRTVEVSRGEIVSTISATGTAEPEATIDVGAQVAGLITTFGTDTKGKPIDYCSYVKKDMLLAKIDPSLYQMDVDTAKAGMAQALAGEAQAQANLVLAQANFHKADRDWQRAQKLGPSEALAETDYDGYQSAYETTKATVQVDIAAIAAAKANTAAAKAALEKAQQNVDYCTITAPVNGVIVARRVNIGETVVSSLSAPSLFLIAEDLTKMELWVPVNEADIGSVHPGQTVTFTADAVPGRTFKGTVGKIRLNASMTQNVVTYTVEVQMDNSDGKLLPYATINANFEVARRENAMQVPNAALRWEPTPEELALGATIPEAPATTRPANDGAQRYTHGTLWVVDTEDPSRVRPLPVMVGISDNTMTEVSGEGLSEGMKVVEGEDLQVARGPGGNAFMPQFGRARKNATHTGTGSGGGGTTGKSGGSGGGSH